MSPFCIAISIAILIHILGKVYLNWLFNWHRFHVLRGSPDIYFMFCAGLVKLRYSDSVQGGGFVFLPEHHGHAFSWFKIREHTLEFRG